MLLELDEVEQALALHAEVEAFLLANGRLPHVLGARATFARLTSVLALKTGRYQEAILHGRESLRLIEESGGPLWEHVALLINLGDAYFHLGQADEARAHLLEALRRADEMTGRLGTTWQGAVRRWLGLADYQRGNLDRALEYVGEGLRLGQQIRDNNIIALCVGLSAAIAAKQGQPVRAARLAGASAAMWARQKRKPREDSSLDTLLPGWREGPERAAIQAAFEAGQAMNAEQAVAYALGEATDRSGLRPD